MRSVKPLQTVLLFLLCSPSAFALTFTPSEQEWTAWPDYCRARYVVSGEGRSSKFALRISKEVVATYEVKIGATAWHWLHHFCAGLVYMDRAKNDSDPKNAAYLRETAQRQFIGQYQRVPPSDPFFPELATAMARLDRDMGNSKAAIEILREGIKAQPKASALYGLSGLIYRDDGDIDSAIAVLQEGDRAIDGQSAELHYFLGLIYADTGQLDQAEEHARQAYALGYPLPGLRNKLREQGRSLD